MDHDSDDAVGALVGSGVGERGGVNLHGDGYCQSETYEHSSTAGNNII
jgi:hypothetical protein